MTASYYTTNSQRIHQNESKMVNPSSISCFISNIRWTVLLFSLLTTTTRASFYPRPVDDASRARAALQWEPIEDLRARWQMPFHYKPVALHPEECRYLTELECAQADQMKATHIEQSRQDQRAQQQRQLQQGPQAPGPQKRILVVMMRFTDHVGRVLPTLAVMEPIWKDKIAAWLDAQSYGAHAPQFDVLDWIDTDNTEAYYSGGEFGRTDLLDQAIRYVLTQVETNYPDWDWTPYDSNGNGEIDNIIILHSGYNAESFQIDCQSSREPENGIWSHWKYVPNDAWTSPKSGLKAAQYMVTSSMEGACESLPSETGVMVMNYMHSLGLESLYDQGDGVGKGVGMFDIMAYPYGYDHSGEPGSLCAYNKIRLEWITALEVSENMYVQLGPYGRTPDVIQISKPYSMDEYLLLENRQPVGVDTGFFGAGIAIYHIDELQDGQVAAGIPGSEDYPFDHYAVAVLPKDGLYELEHGTNQGDQGDLFVVGDTLGPGMGDTVFPNTDGYQWGYVWENGLTIEVVSECGDAARGKMMVVKITGLGDGEPTGSPECVEGSGNPTESAIIEQPEGAGGQPENPPAGQPESNPPGQSETHPPGQSETPPGQPEGNPPGQEAAQPTDPTVPQETPAPTEPTGLAEVTRIPVTTETEPPKSFTMAPSPGEGDEDGDLVSMTSEVSAPGTASVSRPRPEESAAPGTATASRPGRTEATAAPTEEEFVGVAPRDTTAAPSAAPTTEAEGAETIVTMAPTESPGADSSRPIDDGATAVDDGYDSTTGSVGALPPPEAADQDNSMLKLPDVLASSAEGVDETTPLAILPPQKVDSIQVVEEQESETQPKSGAWTASRWSAACSTLGLIFLSIYL